MRFSTTVVHDPHGLDTFIFQNFYFNIFSGPSFKGVVSLAGTFVKHVISMGSFVHCFYVING
jgi:hypothetical protein